MRRSERSYGWYALTSFTWLLFASNTVVSTPWPFATTDSWSRAVTVALLAYTASFCIFLCRFGGLRFVRAERALWLAAGLGAAAVVFIGRNGLGAAQGLAFLACALLFMGACAAFVWRAASTRQPEHLLLAICVLGFLVAAVHDVLMVMRVLPDGLAYTTVSSPLIMVGMSAILAWSVTRNLRRIERFNVELEERIALTRNELTQTLKREHALELANVRLGERLQLAHDLHDGPGRLAGALHCAGGAVGPRAGGQPVPVDVQVAARRPAPGDRQQLQRHGAHRGHAGRMDRADSPSLQPHLRGDERGGPLAAARALALRTLSQADAGADPASWKRR
jgi:hypothetical protein